MVQSMTHLSVAATREARSGQVRSAPSVALLALLQAVAELCKSALRGVEVRSAVC
jgi:hypothetical protein